MTQKEARNKYGAITGGKWPDELKHCVILSVPTLPWVNSSTGKPVHYIYCNKDMAAPLTQALQSVIQRNLADQLKTFDGCFNIRDVRGLPGNLSAHAYAMAIDINASTNGLADKGDMTPALVACFTEQGFTWGGTFPRLDKMHFSLLGW